MTEVLASTNSFEAETQNQIVSENNDPVVDVLYSIEGRNADQIIDSDFTRAALTSTLPNDVDPTKLQLAYGRYAIPKLVYQLEDDSILVVQKSLVFLADLFHSPDNIFQGISEQVVPRLVKLVSSEDLTCRQKSTECLRVISGFAIGRASMIKSDALKAISQLLDEKDILIRKNIHEALSNATSVKEGVQNFMENNLFLSLIEHITKERLDIQVDMLNTCYNCIRFGTTPLVPAVPLASPALSIFTEIAKKSVVGVIKVAASRCIMALCFFHEAKSAAVKSETIIVMIGLLRDRKTEVRAAAAGALMSISIDCDGKRILVRENALTTLIELLSDPNELVLLNSIKTITNCAEDYRGRFQLTHSLRQLEMHKSSPNALVAEAARRAIAVITWRP